MAKEKTKKIDYTSFTTKEEARKAALAQINKEHGEGTAMLFADAPLKVDTVSTGSLSLDIALGCGGYPRGRTIELYGLESSGKTTLALSAIAQVQARGGTAAFIDAEHALDPKWATKLGVSINDLVISQPDHGEQALDICEELITSGGFDIVVVDSVAALVPKAEIEGDMGDHHVGVQARLMSQALRKLNGVVSETNTILIFINQIRMKIGVMYGNPETTTGGNALKFYASQRLEIRRGESIEKDDEKIGNKIKIKVVKNKVAPPFREVLIDLLYSTGLDAMGSLLDSALAADLVEKSGAWYSLNGERMGQGRDNSILYLQSNPKVAEDLDKKVRLHYRLT